MGKVAVSKDRIADLLEKFKYDRGNLILANSLDQIIRKQTRSAFQDWTVGVVGGSGPAVELARGLQFPGTPRRAVRYAPEGASGSFRVSGTSARLAGSTDLAKTYEHDAADLQEPAVYGELPHPTLLIYPLVPNFDIKTSSANAHQAEQARVESATARAAWEKAGHGEALCLMALKLAIPGEPGAKGGDVEYLLNGPAIEEFAQEFEFEVSPFDEADLDE
jgi:hypothetical protein